MRHHPRTRPLLITAAIAALLVAMAAQAGSGVSYRTEDVGGMCLIDDTQTFWDVLVAEVIETIPLIYPDTHAVYLEKVVPPNPDVAYRVEFTLPYATFSSTAIYQDSKAVSGLRDQQYVLGDGFLDRGRGRGFDVPPGPPSGVPPGPPDRNSGIPNPYQPGHLVNTPRDLRKVVLFVTPDFDAAVAQGAANPIFINFEKQRNLIFQRVYYANRSNPDNGRSFRAASDFDRLGYTLPQRIQCVDPRNLKKAVRCPRFESFDDFPILDMNIEPGRTPPPQPPGHCPNRLRWDRPQLEAVHWAGVGSLDNTGRNIPVPEDECTGYLLTMLRAKDDGSSGKRLPSIVMTRIQTPPGFFDVTKLEDDPYFPTDDPDTRYIGIQNYGTFGGDVRYDQQSRSVSEIVKYCPDGVTGARCQERESGFEWIFLHYTRPIATQDREVVETWAAERDVNQQQLAIWKDDPELFRHPPFMMIRQKGSSAAFRSSSPGYIRENVACYSWNDGGGDATKGGWNTSPLSNAADGSRMGTYVPITVTCDFAQPGNLTPTELDDCLATLRATNPNWGEYGANCTP